MNTKELNIKGVKLMLGAEMRRVREEKGLSVEEAAAAAGIERSNVIRSLEAGRGSKIYFIFKLLEIYQKRLSVRLVD